MNTFLRSLFGLLGATVATLILSIVMSVIVGGGTAVQWWGWLLILAASSLGFVAGFAFSKDVA